MLNDILYYNPFLSAKTIFKRIYMMRFLFHI